MATNIEVWKTRGWLVRFNEVDLVGDVFTTATDFFFGKSMRVPVLYEHGNDSLLGLKQLGEGTVTKEVDGLSIEANLEVPAMLGSALRRLTRELLLGWSSGAAGHTVRPSRAAPRGGVNYIKSWGIAEASLTTQPAMPLLLSRVLMKRWSYDEYAFEIEARLALSNYEMINRQVCLIENKQASYALDYARSY